MRYFCLITLLFGATITFASSADLGRLLPQYPRAEMVEFEDTKAVTTHEIVIGSLRSRQGKTAPESSLFVTGRRIASTWAIPDEQRPERVYGFYRQRLADLGEVLFECEGFECGSSNHWANDIFNRQILYGPAQDQHYLMVRIDRDVTYYVALYVAQRGTRQLYAHTDVVITETEYTEATGAAIVDELISGGRFVIDAGAQTAVVDSVVDAMRLQPLMRIAVVSHQRKQRGESVDQAISRSREFAEQYRADLISAGISSTRLQAYGVGPLSPVDRKLIDRIELVLISNDERP